MLLKTVILSGAYEPQKDAFSSSQSPDNTKKLKNIAILNLKQFYMYCYVVLANYFKWNHVAFCWGICWGWLVLFNTVSLHHNNNNDIVGIIITQRMSSVVYRHLHHMTIHCWWLGGVRVFEKGVQQIKKHTYG